MERLPESRPPAGRLASRPRWLGDGRQERRGAGCLLVPSPRPCPASLEASALTPPPTPPHHHPPFLPVQQNTQWRKKGREEVMVTYRPNKSQPLQGSFCTEIILKGLSLSPAPTYSPTPYLSVALDCERQRKFQSADTSIRGKWRRFGGDQHGRGN